MTSPIGFRTVGSVPNLPTPPTGFAVAAYPTYASAQAAVEQLIKHDFSIQDVTIVGSDLQLVERVTGRLTAGKLAAAGAASGRLDGSVRRPVDVRVLARAERGRCCLILAAVAIGAAFGAVMGYLGYSVAKGRRDFTSASQVVARRYDVLCEPRTAEQARDILARWSWDGASRSGSCVTGMPARRPAAHWRPRKLGDGAARAIRVGGHRRARAGHGAGKRPGGEELPPGRSVDRPDRQASALALSCSNSCWVMVPLSSSALASAMCSAGDLLPATSRM